MSDYSGIGAIASAMSFLVALYLAVRLSASERPQLRTYRAVIDFQPWFWHTRTLAVVARIDVVNLSRTANAVVGMRVRAITGTGSGALSIMAGRDLPSGEIQFTSPGHEWTLPRGFPTTSLPSATIEGLGVLPMRFMLVGSIENVYGSAAAATLQRGTPPEPPDYRLEIELEDIQGKHYKSKAMAVTLPFA